MDPSPEAPRPASGSNSSQTPIAVVRKDGPDQASAGTTADPVIDTPHLARFEFSDAGTKILMVEWLPEAAPEAQTGEAATAEAATAVQDTTASTQGGAQVSWAGKSIFLPAKDTEAESTSSSSGDSPPRRRIFYLLPPAASIPQTVTITLPGKAPIELVPLPAIFPEGFLDAETGRGTRGVLHTIWAKKRVKQLEREMEFEMKTNPESVGLEMALKEKQWIIDTFLRPPVAHGSGPGTSPITPRSAGASGRLGEKLKGLRLATSPDDLSPSANTFITAGSQSQTLSPIGSDVAVSSFSSISRSVGQSTGAPMSLDAIARGDIGIPRPATGDAEEDLFALPMSPRSPEMKKSPFSIL
ncbi:unnamed protein product [Clonostachys rhizophaga]|uniref:Uncharacterized protein n=1 Tax=Clonostachys rhizophaga TaxID=160324 RepID=A0A9N9VN17_9HYPO|nr:unnamed protein product [Clonostachys rhizophaga]